MTLAEDGQRPPEQLQNVAKSLLKGCEYHHDQSITRVGRIGEVVPPDTEDEFKNLCRQMRVTTDGEELKMIVESIRGKWPRTTPWLDWWLAPEHAAMIFPAYRTMVPEVASRLPSTTNPEEAMHYIIYRIAGRANDIVMGFEGLIQVEKFFHNLDDVAAG
jgi:hypothetical protein